MQHEEGIIIAKGKENENADLACKIVPIAPIWVTSTWNFLSQYWRFTSGIKEIKQEESLY